MSAAATAAIAAAIRDMYEAFLAGDRRRFDTHLHPAVTTWESHLPDLLPDRAALDAYRDDRDAAGQRPALARLDAEQPRIEVWDGTGLARYLLVAEPGGGRAAQRFRVTDVLRRVDGEWLIVHHHSERLPEEAG